MRFSLAILYTFALASTITVTHAVRPVNQEDALANAIPNVDLVKRQLISTPGGKFHKRKNHKGKGKHHKKKNHHKKKGMGYIQSIGKANDASTAASAPFESISDVQRSDIFKEE